MTAPTDHPSVSVPASTANLGAGFDVLGLALGLYGHVGLGPIGPNSRRVDRYHPAAVAFDRAGGRGAIYVDSPIPIGRGVGFSGAMRVGGAALAIATRRDDTSERRPFDADERAETYTVAAELEGHGDNAAASVYGGLVAVSGDRVVEAPIALGYDPVVVVWVPDRVTTSTNRSRSSLPDRIDRGDAVFNLGRVAALLTGFASGDPELIGHGVDDRWHTEIRLAAAPATARALDAARSAATDAAWLSGSGPSVAMLCRRDVTGTIADSLPADGHVKFLEIDRRGVSVTI